MSNETPDIIQIMPAVGWIAVYKGPEGKDAVKRPVIAWGLCAEGHVYGIDLHPVDGPMVGCEAMEDFLRYEESNVHRPGPL
jgi:hypothetical protein